MSINISDIKKNLTLIELNEKKIYLIGTAHVSSESVELVEETINQYNPDTIAIELDDERYESITQKNKFQELDVIKIIKKKQLFFFIGQFILSSFQKKIAEKTGSQPGAEFKKAIELAKEKDIHLVLADRNVGTTLKRAWRLTTFMQKLKLFGSLLFSKEDDLDDLNIEELMKKDAINEMIETFGEGLPQTKKVLIDERDTFLTKEIQDNAGDVTVAIVGAGHVPGMLKQIGTEISEEQKDEMNFVPNPSIVGKILPWIIPFVIIAIFTLGFFYGKHDMAKDVAIYWVLANGILAAIGCALAFGHPLTIIAGFIAAPITSLNPTIGAGFVTAIVQAFLVRPRVKDFEQIQQHTLKIKNWWSNRLTKIFLVFIFSSIGSSIGTFIALPALTKFFTG